MSNGIKEWWGSVEKSEKPAIVALGVIAVSVFLLAAGIWIGQAIGRIAS